MKSKIEHMLHHKWGMPMLILFLLLISRFLLYLIFFAWSSYTGNQRTFFDVVNTWDSGWYRGIIADGYMLAPSVHQAGDAANWAFFPLMPMLMKLISNGLHLDLNITGSLVNTVLFAIALMIACKYIKKTRGSNTQIVLFCIVYTMGAYTFYFSLLYTEALFFFLVVLFFYFMNEEKYIMMGLMGALASATRNLGVMLVFAIAAKYTADFFAQGDEKNIRSYFICAFKNYKLVLGVALIPLGLFLYMLYLDQLTGDALAFVHIQRAWSNNGGGFREVASALIRQTFSKVFLLSSFGFVGGIGCLYMAKQARWAEAVMGLIFILIPFSVRTTSMPRYVMGAFLPVLGCTDLLSKCPGWVKISVIMVLVAGEFILFYGWLNGWDVLVI